MYIYHWVGKRKERGMERGRVSRWRLFVAAPLNLVTAVMICHLSSHFLMPPPTPNSVFATFGSIVCFYWAMIFFFLYLMHSLSVILSCLCLHPITCVCGQVKWSKVFLLWFWVALVEEVDTWVSVLQQCGPGLHVVLLASSVCNVVGGLHFTWLL